MTLPTQSRRWIWPLLSICLLGAELPPEYQAKFLKVLLKSSDLPMKVQCSDVAFQAELKKAGIEIDSSAKVVWASNPQDVKKYKSEGLLVVCPNLDLLKEGGSVALVEEGGRPIYYLHRDNIQKSGIKLGDTLYKIGKTI